MRHRGCARLLVAFLALAMGGRLAAACDVDVRENGFVTGQGMPYMLREYALYFLDRKVSPEMKAHAERLQKLCYEKMAVTNLVVDTAALDELSEDNIKELKSGGVDLSSLPVTVLISGSGTFMTAPGLLGEAGVRALVVSPKKKKLKDLLADTGNYCVLVFVPSGEEKADAAAMARTKAALAAHRKEYPTQVMPVLRVDRDDPAEAFLLSELGVTSAEGAAASAASPMSARPAFRTERLWPVAAALVLFLALFVVLPRGKARLAGIGAGLLFLGLSLCVALAPAEGTPLPVASGLPTVAEADDEGEVEPLLLVAFGKGRVLLTPFAGEAITQENLAGSFEYLNHNASDCTVDAVFVNEDTFDLLMYWEPAVENKILLALEEAGVELYNPWSEVEFDESGQPVERASEGAAPAPGAPAAAPGATLPPVLAYVLPALGGVLVLVVLAGWIILRKKRSA